MTTTFKQYNFKPFIMNALDELNFKEPTKIQENIIPEIMKGRSVIGQSATGSGKTHAFLLPIFEEVNPDENSVQAVITTPSRELAYQIYENAKQLAKHSDQVIHLANYVGGTDKKRQIEKLKNEQPQIVIGTPGRVADLIKSQHLDVHTAKNLVIDEADMTMDLGFLNEVDTIAASFGKDVQMMVFSATIPQKLRTFLKKYMTNPYIENIPNASVINPNIDNLLISTKGENRNDLIYKLITMGEPYLVLIFANTKKRVEELYEYLRNQGLKVGMVSGALTPRERKRMMKQIQNLDFQFVVATDLAARGIDIEGVSDVINDDIPEDLEYFIHRVGRTGRNNMSGTAITLYDPDEEDEIDALEKMGISFKPKAIKGGSIVDTYDRNRRKSHRRGHDKLQPNMIGMIKKKKRNIKPGYKRKIKNELKRNDEMNRRVEQREEGRRKRKSRKNSSQRYR
ncbi:ATP-dependent helicase [Apilactobacillus micheneri]|uniref:DEAD-box ATP-dependent RNA helicase CshB n=1 Tax=Apilactobacillus micheneri TaxID=1899430 RepID=A0ABY2YXS9_9LACO|nr:DEAD/DEAH box helicase [Apilactobacillus micheneri]TPR24360.1 ATP-dependent helicase [Apilactobacillus micheneri]TPR25379.1 ATP-dependent helicase [Apilactobacillus micheneri]TPR27691.1 ATP-dependent helicase [Apilactobacillus micheneri]TPR28956.1 ATP-dependent helicase [Apilactobacillus micheneri]TPR29978.1 ATP-dependent helicase [Apilactobacillus micheneri]